MKSPSRPVSEPLRTEITEMNVFSLVLDRDISEDLSLIYPELYKELTKVGDE